MFNKDAGSNKGKRDSEVGMRGNRFSDMFSPQMYPTKEQPLRCADVAVHARCMHVTVVQEQGVAWDERRCPRLVGAHQDAIKDHF